MDVCCAMPSLPLGSKMATGGDAAEDAPASDSREVPGSQAEGLQPPGHPDPEKSPSPKLEAPKSAKSLLKAHRPENFEKPEADNPKKSQNPVALNPEKSQAHNPRSRRWPTIPRSRRIPWPTIPRSRRPTIPRSRRIPWPTIPRSRRPTIPRSRRIPIPRSRRQTIPRSRRIPWPTIPRSRRSPRSISLDLLVLTCPRLPSSQLHPLCRQL